MKALHKLGKVEAKVVKVKKSKEKLRAMPKKIVVKPSVPLPLWAKHEPAAVADPSQFTGLDIAFTGL
jgi:hypothetical protein